jgi:hypothetical protein
MILEQLGKLVDAEALTGSDTYVGYCIDLVSAVTEFGISGDVWVVLSANVAADYTTGDETYEFQIRGGTGVDGSDDINAGVVVIESTSALNGNDVRLATAGMYIWRHTLDHYASKFQYLQLYYAQTGTTPTITVDFSLSPSRPPSDRNMQVELSPVGLP